jgi:hypothetical protein
VGIATNNGRRIPSLGLRVSLLGHSWIQSAVYPNPFSTWGQNKTPKSCGGNIIRLIDLKRRRKQIIFPSLSEHATKSVREKRKHEPRPTVQVVIVSVRNASENDPGECAVGYFIVRGDIVTLTDERGTALDGKEGSAKIGSDVNSKSIAQMMTRRRWEATRGGDFNRRIVNPKSGWS